MFRSPFGRLQVMLFAGICAGPILGCAQTPTPAPLNLPVPSPSPALPFPETESRQDGFVPPKARLKLPVAYPELAHLNRTEGVVTVQFSVDENGDVTKAIVTHTSKSIMLDAVVKDYNLLHWKFDPATLNGKPVPSTKEQEFEFRLDPAEEKAIAIKRLALPVGTPDAPYPKEAIPLKLRGSVTIGVRWTKRGLVDLIYLKKGSGYIFLDHAALRWAYENWHIDPATLNEKNKDDEFVKTINFEPPR